MGTSIICYSCAISFILLLYFHFNRIEYTCFFFLLIFVIFIFTVLFWSNFTKCWKLTHILFSYALIRFMFFFVYCVVVFCFLLINDFFLFSFLLSESFISKINQALMKSELIESYFNANGSKLESLFSRQAWWPVLYAICININTLELNSNNDLFWLNKRYLCLCYESKTKTWSLIKSVIT